MIHNSDSSNMDIWKETNHIGRNRNCMIYIKEIPLGIKVSSHIQKTPNIGIQSLTSNIKNSQHKGIDSKSEIYVNDY